MSTADESRESLAFLKLEPLLRLTEPLQQLLRTRLWAKVTASLLAGVAVGLLGGPEVGWVDPVLADRVTEWLALPGQLFLAIIQMLVVPLVFASIIRGLGGSDSTAQLQALGFRAAAYFVGTTVVALIIGLGFTLTAKPGRHFSLEAVTHETDLLATPAEAGQDPPRMTEVIVGLLPRNPLAAMVDDEMLKVVVFAIIIGVALVSMPVARSKPLFDLLGALQDVCMTIVRWAMRLAPLAVFGLIARVASKLGVDAMIGMGAYVVTVVAALLTHAVFYLVVLVIVARMSPRRFLSAAREAQLLAFSTSSSAAVMPMSMKAAEQQLGVRGSTARFVIPLGATVNMDGTALYQGAATVFLAQAFGLELAPSALIFVVVTAVAASIGAPATPGVGIAVLAGVLSSVGIPAAGIALILGVDRILDMVRTVVNVTGDLTAAVVLDRWMGERFEPRPPETPA
ncbi:MAG: dicarboxylate/amino acid:cation symporter [Myxococcales bacterium FL481]|nr:MAG: dicarboxylate/amino acid:cation symporter [Myxococcales bacterium FL481]